MPVRVVKPRVVRRFRVYYMFRIPEELGGVGRCVDCVEVAHIENNVYSVIVNCEDTVDRYYIVADSPDEIDVELIKKLAKETCHITPGCVDVTEVREVQRASECIPYHEPYYKHIQH